MKKDKVSWGEKLKTFLGKSMCRLMWGMNASSEVRASKHFLVNI